MLVEIHLLPGMQIGEKRNAAQHRHDADADFHHGIFRAQKHVQVTSRVFYHFFPATVRILRAQIVLNHHRRRQRHAEKEADQRQRRRPNIAAHGFAQHLKRGAI